MTEHPLDRLPHQGAGAEVRVGYGGVARIVVLCILMAGGRRLIAADLPSGLYVLPAFYAVGFVFSVFQVLRLRRTEDMLASLTKAQVGVDFAVVAATVFYTGGPRSLLTFLFVIVILEAGVLMGMGPSIAFATVAVLFTFLTCLRSAGPDDAGQMHESVMLWYSVLIQILAFYLTAFISGYWSQRIHHLRRFQREIMDNMNTGFLISDRSGTIVALNKAGERILNLEPGAALGRPATEVLKVQAGGESPIMTALRSRRDFTSYEFSAETGEGEIKLLGLTTSKMHDPQDKMSGVIASFTDLTEMAKMRAELRRQDRMAVIGELAAGLAHEIRNPVAAIAGAVEELKSSVSSEGMVGRLAAIATRESDHLNEIVSGFLDFARKPTVKRELLNLRELVEEVAALLGHDYAHAEKLTIAVDSPQESCVISGDRSQLKQVLVNLGKNAVEAMEESGTLSLVVAPGAGFTEVRLEDEGPGIPPDQVARIFEPFYTTKKRGVGMGLAVCLRIVTAHDGMLRAVSRAGGGTTMSVQLPVARTEE